MSGITVLCANWTARDDAELERRWFPDLTFNLHRRIPGQDAELRPDWVASANAVVNYSASEGLGTAPAAFAACRVAVRAGVGFDTLDLAGWAARGVPACNVPDYGTTEVADHAIALMLALTRGTACYDDMLRRDGSWTYASAPLVRRLRGAAFGVLGLGRIGLAAANRAAAFGMRVVFLDPYLPSGTELAVGFARVHSLAELMQASDVLSIHVPLTDQTRGLIGRAALEAARPGLILINTARGPIVDLDALATGLKGGRIGGAGLDVLPREPGDLDHPLLEAWRAGEDWLRGRLTISPHAAFFSPSAEEDLRRKAIEVVLAYLMQGRLTNCVNASLMAAA